jgi:multiple sugar transport system substrate-binding protein
MKGIKNLTFLIIVVALLIVSCQAATPTPEVPMPEETERIEEPEEEIVLRLWHQESVDRRVRVLQGLLDEFYAETGIKVIQETMTWDDQYVKLMAAIAAGDPPELSWGAEGTTLTLHTAGAAYPVTDLVEEIDALHEYMPSRKNTLFWEGEYWGIPIFGLNYNFWYRTDMFEKFGLNPPETWEDVIHAAEVCNDPPNHWGIALPTGETMYGEQVVSAVYYGIGGIMMGQGNELKINSSELLEALRIYEQLAQYTPPDSGVYAWPDAGIAMAQSKACMLITFNAILDFEQVEENLPENLGIVKMPSPPGVEPRTQGSTLNLIVTTDDPIKKEAIRKWVLFMMKPENYGRWAANFEPGLFLPVTKSGMEADSFWQHEIVFAYEEQVKNILEFTKYNFSPLWYPGDTPDPHAGVIGQGRPLMTAVQMILYQGASHQEAANHAEKMILENLGW